MPTSHELRQAAMVALTHEIRDPTLLFAKDGALIDKTKLLVTGVLLMTDAALQAGAVTMDDNASMLASAFLANRALGAEVFAPAFEVLVAKERDESLVSESATQYLFDSGIVPALPEAVFLDQRRLFATEYFSKLSGLGPLFQEVRDSIMGRPDDPSLVRWRVALQQHCAAQLAAKVSVQWSQEEEIDSLNRIFLMKCLSTVVDPVAMVQHLQSPAVQGKVLFSDRGGCADTWYDMTADSVTFTITESLKPELVAGLQQAGKNLSGAFLVSGDGSQHTVDKKHFDFYLHRPLGARSAGWPKVASKGLWPDVSPDGTFAVLDCLYVLQNWDKREEAAFWATAMTRGDHYPSARFNLRRYLLADPGLAYHQTSNPLKPVAASIFAQKVMDWIQHSPCFKTPWFLAQFPFLQDLPPKRPRMSKLRDYSALALTATGSLAGVTVGVAVATGALPTLPQLTEGPLTVLTYLVLGTAVGGVCGALVAGMVQAAIRPVPVVARYKPRVPSGHAAPVPGYKPSPDPVLGGSDTLRPLKSQ